MTARKKPVELIGDIKPHQIYRTTLSPALFGYGAQSTSDKEKSGELPKSFPLSPSSRYRAWTGQQILDHRAKMQALAAEQTTEKRPQPPQLVKPRKVKLRPPAKTRQRESA